MAEEYVLPQPESLSISLQDADRLISAGSGDAALLYLYILRRGGKLDREKARTELGLGKRLDAAVSTLQKLCMVQLPGGIPVPEGERLAPGSAEETPTYTVADVERAAETVAGFRELLDETAKRLRRLLSTNDLLILYGLYDDLGMQPEVILVVISWCVQESERRYGPGKRITLRQIEKEAYIWQNGGIVTLEQAEKHVQDLLDRRQECKAAARCLGIRNRELVPSEEKYIRAWLDMGFKAEAIGEAYERTILKKNELAWPYLNRILENWHKKDLHTLEKILEGDPREKNTPKRQEDARKSSGPDAEEYRQMQRFLAKMNGGGGDGT
jgi:DnaD/phage-associated family protein